MIKIFFLLGFKILLLHGIVVAQNAKKIDSVWKVYQNLNNNELDRLDAINYIADVYRNNNPDSSILLCDQMLITAKKLNSSKYITSFYLIKGTALMNKGQYDESITAYTDALNFNKKEKNNFEIGRCYNNLAIVYQKKGDYPLTLENYLAALKIYDNTKGSEIQLSNTYNNIARFYATQKDYTKALQYLNNAIIIKTKIGDERELANTYNNLGIVYRRNKQINEAIIAQNKALQLRQKIDDKRGIADSYTNIGALYNETGNTEEAIKHMFKAVAINKEIGNKEGVEIAYANISSFYNSTSKDSLAKVYANEALKISNTISNKENKQFVLKTLAQSQFKTDSFKDAYENLVMSKALNDSLFNVSNSNILSDLKTDYEVEKKETELKIIANEEKKYEAKIAEVKLSKQRNQKIAFASLALLALGGIGFTFYHYKQKKKTNEKINQQNETLKTLNTELIESEESLVKSNATKEQLINMMSHDLLNPITAITNYNQQILNRTNNTEELTEAFKTVDAAIQPMHGLLDNMLQWTAIQKDGITAKLKLQDVNDIEKEVIAIYKPQAKLKSIIIKDDLQHDFIIETDKSILSLILRNLLNNAIKYSADNTTITVFTDAVNTSIIIKDEGYGMSAEMITKLNEKQFDDIEAKGTGLGLKLCSQFAAALGATIEFEKNEQNGITTNIKLA